MTAAVYSVLNIHPSGVLIALFFVVTWLVPRQTAAVSAQVLCTLLNVLLNASGQTSRGFVLSPTLWTVVDFIGN